MKIGIDAKWYFEGPPSGRRVVRALVDAILEIDVQNHYFIFLNSKHRERDFRFKGRKNVDVVYVWAGNNALSNVFVLPFYSNMYGLHAMLYQTFSSPFDKSRTIAYVHDVLFLSNPEYYTLYERLYFSPLKFLTRRSSVIITVSEEEKKRLLDFNYSDEPGKIVVAYHGVDSSFAPCTTFNASDIDRVRQKFNLPETFLLFVGRLNLRKNVDNLLRAIPFLENKEIPLVIVGADEWKKSNHMRIVRELAIETRIHFIGAVYEDLGIIYSLSEIFCFPSYAESFGLPPLEAMASGVPVVVSNTTSLPEICGEAGTYAPPNEPAEIAKAIDTLLTNDQLYAKKRESGLVQASKFTWERAAQIVIDCARTNKQEIF